MNFSLFSACQSVLIAILAYRLTPSFEESSLIGGLSIVFGVIAAIHLATLIFEDY